jgi:hypothetical protein
MTIKSEWPIAAAKEKPNQSCMRWEELEAIRAGAETK